MGYQANIATSELQNEVVRLSLESHVEIIDRRLPSIEEKMAQTSLAIIPSLGSEVICRVAEEFLLCGCPLVVSDAGSLAESIDGFGGLNLGPLDSWGTRIDDVVSLIKSSYAESEDIRSSRAAKARSIYSLDAMSQSLLSLIKPKK